MSGKNPLLSEREIKDLEANRDGYLTLEQLHEPRARENQNPESVERFAKFVADRGFIEGTLYNNREASRLLIKAARILEDSMVHFECERYANILERERDEGVAQIIHILDGDYLKQRVNLWKSFAKRYRREAAIEKVTKDMNPLCRALYRVKTRIKKGRTW